MEIKVVVLQVALHVHGVACVLYFYKTVLTYRVIFINFVCPIKLGWGVLAGESNWQDNLFSF